MKKNSIKSSLLKLSSLTELLNLSRVKLFLFVVVGVAVCCFFCFTLSIKAFVLLGLWSSSIDLDKSTGSSSSNGKNLITITSCNSFDIAINASLKIISTHKLVFLQVCGLL